jgi:LmbE family N-acetylglucosaminyl deacetylase
VAGIFYLSPHADDVALSCGGCVAADVQAGLDVTLITVFSEGPGPRRQEDQAACARLGCRHVWLGLPDAVERPEVRSQLDLFAPLGQRHLGILSEVAARLRPHLVPGAQVAAPLGVGGHIDHRLVHAAARAVAEAHPIDLRFYEDQPYSLARYAIGRRLCAIGARLVPPGPAVARAARREEVRAYREYLAQLPLMQLRGLLGAVGLGRLMQHLAARAAVAADDPRRQPGFRPTLRAEIRDVTPFLDARLQAIAAYASQWPQLFPSLPAARQALLQHGRAARGEGAEEAHLYERLWRVTRDPDCAHHTIAMAPYT